MVAAFERRGAERFVLVDPDEASPLKPFSRREQLHHEFTRLGGLLNAHLVDLRAEQYATLKLTPSSLLKQMKDGSKVRVGGVNAVRQRPPTEKGTAFLAVEDKLGMMNVIVPKAIYERDRQASCAPFVIIEGRVQRADNVINVVADKVLSPGS